MHAFFLLIIIISSVSLAQSPNASYIGLYNELVNVFTHFRQCFPYISHKLSNKESGLYALELAHLIFMAHDIIGWGDLNNIRKNLDVSFIFLDKKEKKGIRKD